MLSVAIRDLQLRHTPPRLHVFAPSMGGLVARRAVQLLSTDDNQRLCLFITLSTPWDGHPSAASGVRDVPLDIPVWRDMAPGSPYLQRLFATPLPVHMRQWLLVSYAGNTRMLPNPNDGTGPWPAHYAPPPRMKPNACSCSTKPTPASSTAYAAMPCLNAH